MDQVFEQQLQKLEANRLASFTYGLAQIEANLTADQFSFNQDGSGSSSRQGNFPSLAEIETRIADALRKATCLRQLWLVVPSENSALQDCIQFLATSSALRDVTLICFNKDNADDCVRAVQHSSVIRRFELHSSEFPMEAICDLISLNRSIEDLDLKGTETSDLPHIFNLDTPAIMRLAFVLSSSKTLRKIHFERFLFRSNRRRHRRFHRNHSVSTVSLSSCYVDTESSHVLAYVFGAVREVFVDNVNVNEFLMGLAKINPPEPLFIGIKTNSLPTVSSAFIKILKRKGLVSGFCLRSERQNGCIENGLDSFQPETNLFFEQLSSALRNNASITSLEFSPITDRGIGLLSDTINFSSTNVTTLKLDCSREESFPYNLTLYLLRVPNCTIQTFELSNCNLQEGGFAELSWTLTVNTSVTSFSLKDYSHLSYSDIEVLGKNLSSFSLSHLALKGCDLYEDFGIVIFRVLAYMLNPPFTSLELDYVHFDHECVINLSRILEREDSNLQVLKLKGSHIPSGDLPLILKALAAKDETPLKNLQLAISVLDLNALAKVLPRLHLESLIVEVRTQGADLNMDGRDTQSNITDIKNRLIQAMAKNKQLIDLRIDWEIDEHFFHNRLRFYCLRNRIKPLYALSASNQMPPGLWPRILESLHRTESCPSILYHVLSQSLGMMSHIKDGGGGGEGDVDNSEDGNVSTCSRNSGPLSAILSRSHSSLVDQVVTASCFGCLPWLRKLHKEAPASTSPVAGSATSPGPREPENSPTSCPINVPSPSATSSPNSV